MSKNYIQNGALIPAEDEQIIAKLTAYLSVSLRNERSKYLKKYGKIRDFESSIEDLKPDFEPEDSSFEESPILPTEWSGPERPNTSLPSTIKMSLKLFSMWCAAIRLNWLLFSPHFMACVAAKLLA